MISVPAPPADQAGSPWVVVLTIALAAAVLALVFGGLRLAAGRSPSDAAVEVPARADTGPTTTSPSSSPGSPSTTTRAPTTSTPTTAPGAATTVPPVIDPTSPRITVSDPDGRFEVTVPRSWAAVPSPTGLSELRLIPFETPPGGTVQQTAYIFAVFWASADGCSLDECATQVVDRLTTTSPGLAPTQAPDTLAGLKAVRIEATGTVERLVAWVVVKGDRSFVVSLRGPAVGFEPQLEVAKRVLDTLSFT